MYPASDWSMCSEPIMDISAHAISLSDKPQMDELGHQCPHAPGRPLLHRLTRACGVWKYPRELRAEVVYARIAMAEWLILLLLVPAIVVPVVLLIGFAGCSFDPDTTKVI